MKLGKEHTKYDEDDDYELRNKIKKEYGYLDKEQYIFSKRLLKEMIRRKMTSNQDLVNLTGLAKSTISNYVNGKQKPGFYELNVLSKKLMLPSDYLLGKTNSTTLSAIKVEDMLGISENMMRVLYGLNHDVDEFGDLSDKMERSDVHKSKLNIFSLLAEDKSKFIELLTYFERYVNVKQKLENTNFEEDMLNINTKENIENDLIRNTRNNNKVII